MIKISELRLHDVINVIDGRRLGMIRDIDIDVETGRVRSIILPGNNRVFNLFAKSEEVIIPWEKIVKIGVDVILVEYSATNQLQQK